MKIIEAHRKISRKVKAKDMQLVMGLRNKMFMLCYEATGSYQGGYAIVHSQVEQEDPLRFFITREGHTIINPKIVRHSSYTVESLEGCLSYPDRKQIKVKRYQKIEVEYYDIELKKKSKSISGREAFIWQHEINHMDGKYIYD